MKSANRFNLPTVFIENPQVLSLDGELRWNPSDLITVVLSQSALFHIADERFELSLTVW